MFRKRIFLLIFLWLALVSVGVKLFRSPSHHAMRDYRRLMTLSEEQKKEERGHLKNAKQIREHVSKQILYTQNQQRLQSRLSSDHSELLIDRKGKGFEIIECFNGLHCIMQEKLEGNAIQLHQFVRHLIAKHATYSYATGKLHAEDVLLSRYFLSNPSWSDSLIDQDPLLRGHAQSVDLSLFGTPTLHAHGFQATLHSKGSP